MKIRSLKVAGLQHTPHVQVGDVDAHARKCTYRVLTPCCLGYVAHSATDIILHGTPTVWRDYMSATCAHIIQFDNTKCSKPVLFVTLNNVMLYNQRCRPHLSDGEHNLHSGVLVTGDTSIGLSTLITEVTVSHLQRLLALTLFGSYELHLPKTNSAMHGTADSITTASSLTL